jgi:hypothetical protein
MSDFTMAEVVDELNKLANRCARYGRLIRWLALAYGDNDPMFHFTDFYGHELTANVELAATWEEVVRGRSAGQPVEASNLEEQVLEADTQEGTL